MSSHPEYRRRLSSASFSLLAVAAVASVITVAALIAHPLFAAPFGVPDERAAEIIAALEERFEVLSWSGGHVLEPRSRAAYEIVEVEKETLVIDGESYRLGSAASRDVARGLLGEDFALIAGLSGAEIEADAAVTAADEAPEVRDARPEPRRETRWPRHDRRRDDGSRVSIFDDLEIEAGETVREAVVVMGSLEARGDVAGDTVVVMGSAEIDGYIDGDLTVVGGSISLGPEAFVEGDVTCVGGTVYRADGARIDGEISEVVMAPMPDFDFTFFDPDDLWPFDHVHHYRSRGASLVGLIFNFAAIAVLVLLAAALARRRVDQVAGRVRADPFKAGLVGFLIEILIGPVLVVTVVLMVVSIIGIPLLVLFLPLAALAFVLVLFLGLTAVAQALGESITGRRHAAAPYAAVLLGLLLIQIWQIFGEAMSLLPGPIQVFAALLVALGFIVKYAAWTVGLGAVVLERFGPTPPAA